VNREIERFNRSLKESLLTANIEGKDWKTFTMDFLQTYRATRHATTQRSPAELLHGREMHTKLHISGLQMPKPNTPSHKDTALKVQEKQNKQKVYTDKCHGAKDVNFECGSFV